MTQRQRMLPPIARHRRPARAGRLACLVAATGLGLAALGALPPAVPPAAGIELCSRQARVLMRSVDIAEAKIEALCAKAARGRAPLTLDLVRRRQELGYCRVTLSLTNNTSRYLNALVLASADDRFDLFRFGNIVPGGTGYASANSRILLACDELGRVRLRLHWPATLRIGDRRPSGARLERYKPRLLHPVLQWNR